ncbi:hypothetical protein Taro_007517 [Colocasia esculenta]|uniref:Uncharacterized protein n=1 Tax=Colocasia esculenta TaxID=4460 RepID=A0A843U458_COLES|nr:hypothetical protein [Colocasia esculenta]
MKGPGVRLGWLSARGISVMVCKEVIALSLIHVWRLERFTVGCIRKRGRFSCPNSNFCQSKSTSTDAGEVFVENRVSVSGPVSGHEHHALQIIPVKLNKYNYVDSSAAAKNVPWDLVSQLC